ncbi:protein CFAP20DC-like [Corticium candelabrum]|uniref:protein CFAP20DC-like n=1 Tax=Corticium candelabrum TaxID=121492 RepID=UPI002E27296E|nr:protein CFAP20DC-like [Corticium candelabrum]
MLKSRFQGGLFVEVFSAHGRNPASEWKLSGTASSIRREYDKEVKGYVYVLEGGPTLTKMSLPKDEKQCLGLVQPMIVFQLYVSHGERFSIDLTVSDILKSKRHIFLSSSHKELSCNPLHARIPLATLTRGVWLNFCIDLVSLVGHVFRGETFSALERISVSAACKIRKIFTLKNRPVETTTDRRATTETENDFQLIPKAVQIPSSDITVLTQVFTSMSLQSTRNSDSVCSTSSLATSRKSATESRRFPRSRQQQASSVSRKRSARKRNEGQSSATAIVASSSQPLPKPPIANGDSLPTLPVHDFRSSPPSNKEIPSAVEMEIHFAHPTSSQMDDSLSDRITAEMISKTNEVEMEGSKSTDHSLYLYVSPPHSARHRRPTADADVTMPTADAWPSVESDDELNSSHGTSSSLRGAAYDGDFLSGGDASDEDAIEDRVSRLRMEQKDKNIETEDGHLQVPLMNQTRLSDDYDWRNYQSSSTSAASSFSGLPGRLVDQSFDVSIADDDGGDSLDSSEGEPRAVSVNWQPEHASAHSQPSNARAMGGMLSPPIPLQQPSDEHQLEDDQPEANGNTSESDNADNTDSEEELEVLYDPCLNCYYDPKTHKYYELA